MNPTVQKSSALGSITATYTDSEGEEASGSEGDESSADFHESQPANRETKSTSRESTPTFLASVIPDVVGAPPKSGLVSYFSGEGQEEEDEDSFRIVDSSYSDADISDRSHNRSEDNSYHRPLSPIAFHRSLQLLGPGKDVQLPPECPGRCSNALQEKIAKLYEKKVREGKNMNETIQMRKDFRNPSIYEKLVSYCGIDEKGTNYPPEVYDPHSWGTESFYDELARHQNEEMGKLEKERKERTKVEFISGTVKKPQDSLQTTAAAAIEVARRKSKWDMGVGGGQVLGPSNIKPAALITPNVVMSATGTKPTVISAFGIITKKGKP